MAARLWSSKGKLRASVDVQSWEATAAMDGIARRYRGLV